MILVLQEVGFDIVSLWGPGGMIILGILALAVIVAVAFVAISIFKILSKKPTR